MHITQLDGTAYTIHDGLIADVYQDDDGLWYAPIYELDKDTQDVTFHSFDLPSQATKQAMITAVMDAKLYRMPIDDVTAYIVNRICDAVMDAKPVPGQHVLDDELLNYIGKKTERMMIDAVNAVMDDVLESALKRLRQRPVPQDVQLPVPQDDASCTTGR